jgi:hypothetical protein
MATLADDTAETAVVPGDTERAVQEVRSHIETKANRLKEILAGRG